jgi:hypothetical protein
MNTDEKQTMTLDDGASGGDRWLRMVSRTRAIGRLAVWPVLAAAMLTACGEDGNGGGNEDTLLTGLSGVVILGAVIWFVLRKVKSRG